MLRKRSLLLLLCAAMILCLLMQGAGAEEAHEHVWGAPSYYWSTDLSTVTAQRICTVDSSHNETEVVQTTSLQTQEPTCTEAGVMTYTASFTNPAFTTQTRSRAAGSPLGHDWGAPGYSWSANHAVCVASRVCRNDASHVSSETVQSSSIVTKEATCTDYGVTTYIAKFTNPVYLEQSIDVENIQPLGHTVSSWTVTTKPGCVDPGVETGTCSRCKNSVTRAVAAAGHDWGTPSYEWASDYSEVTATRKCKTNTIHYENETVKTTAKMTKEPTATSAGEMTYTATFVNQAFATQTRSVTMPIQPGGNPFTDVASNRFYYKPILWAVEKGITNGTTSTTFSPENSCTRAEVVTFLWRAYGSVEPTSTGGTPFTDISSSRYYYKAVLWAVQHNITNGMTKTTFGPDLVCTRGHVVTFLWRAEGKPTTVNNGVIAIGGGASTKLTAGGTRIRRSFCPKYPKEYIEKIDELCENKKEIIDWYQEVSS